MTFNNNEDEGQSLLPVKSSCMLTLIGECKLHYIGAMCMCLFKLQRVICTDIAKTLVFVSQLCSFLSQHDWIRVCVISDILHLCHSTYICIIVSQCDSIAAGSIHWVQCIIYMGCIGVTVDGLHLCLTSYLVFCNCVRIRFAVMLLQLVLR